MIYSANGSMTLWWFILTISLYILRIRRNTRNMFAKYCSAYLTMGFMQSWKNANLIANELIFWDIPFHPTAWKWTRAKLSLSKNGRLLLQSMIFKFSWVLRIFIAD